MVLVLLGVLHLPIVIQRVIHFGQRLVAVAVVGYSQELVAWVVIVEMLEQLVLVVVQVVVTEKLGDLYSAQGKPSSAVFAYIQALGLDPSPQQRLRLRLVLGEKLPALERTPEAYADYQELLRELPGYPDKLGICRKLLSLAQALNRKDDAAGYQAEIDRLSPPPPKPQPQETGTNQPKAH